MSNSQSPVIYGLFQRVLGFCILAAIAFTFYWLPFRWTEPSEKEVEHQRQLKSGALYELEGFGRYSKQQESSWLGGASEWLLRGLGLYTTYSPTGIAAKYVYDHVDKKTVKHSFNELAEVSRRVKDKDRPSSYSQVSYPNQRTHVEPESAE